MADKPSPVVHLRELIGTHKELSALEKKYDNQLKLIFNTIRELMIPLEPKKKRPIGFAPWKKE